MTFTKDFHSNVDFKLFQLTLKPILYVISFHFSTEWDTEWTEEGPENIVIELQTTHVDQQKSHDIDLLQSIYDLSRNKSVYSFEGKSKFFFCCFSVIELNLELKRIFLACNCNVNEILLDFAVKSWEMCGTGLRRFYIDPHFTSFTVDL